MILYKISSPGWEKEFQTEDELKQELFKWICKDCKEEFKELDEDGTVLWEQLPIDENSSLDEMLGSACGCEFATDREDNNYVTVVEKRGDEYFIPIPENLLTNQNWVEGDLLEWEENFDNSYTIRKYYND